MDDLERLLYRREAPIPPRARVPGMGAPAFLGQVSTTISGNLAAGKFLLVNPVEVTGSEAEGATPAFAVDTSRTIPVYMASGTPATGDKLIVRRVDHRWVASKPAGVATGPKALCFCPNGPDTISRTSNLEPTPRIYTFYSTKPSYTPPMPDSFWAARGPGYFSELSGSGSGRTFFFIPCNSVTLREYQGQVIVSTGAYSVPLSGFQEPYWFWTGGTCDPFLFTGGQGFPNNAYFVGTTSVTISG